MQAVAHPCNGFGFGGVVAATLAALWAGNVAVLLFVVLVAHAFTLYWSAQEAGISR